MPTWVTKYDDVEAVIDLNCAVNKCRLTTNHDERRTADLVIFRDHYVPTQYSRPSQQIYAFYTWESPHHAITQVPYPGNNLLFLLFKLIASV